MTDFEAVRMLSNDLNYLRESVDKIVPLVSQIPDIKADTLDVKKRVSSLETANAFAKGYWTGGLWVFGIVCGGVGASLKMLFAFWPKKGQ